MKRFLPLILCAIVLLQRAAADGVDYVTQIKPILVARCYACHGALRVKSGLRLDTAALLIKGGEGGPAIEPGNLQNSRLLQVLTGEAGFRMPPEDEGAALTPEQIALVKQWIEEGARAPEETPQRDPRDHWAYQPPVRSVAPAVKNTSWGLNPVDAFVAAKHHSHGVTPVAAADKPVLLRRVYLDLIGLPPTREEMSAYLADESPQAYEKVVDRLLASPQYGQRWARHWMDVWRYSDWSGSGQEIRNSARHIWRWRDWIIESLNADKGYDQMVREMLAGDEIAPTDPDTLRATGFLVRNWYLFNRTVWLDNTVEHTAKAFLGTTINCARCHDHKYDPLEQVEYYRLRAIFEPHEIRTDRVPGEANLDKDGLVHAADLKPNTPTYLFVRGSEIRPDKEHPLEPGVPAALGGEFHVEPVEIPLTARYPALREFAIQEDLAAAAKMVADAEAARTKAQAEVAVAQQKLDALSATDSSKEKTEGDSHSTKEQKADARKTIEAAVGSAELTTKHLATVRAAEVSLTARIAAEKAKYGLLKEVDAAQLAKSAAKAEREQALCQAEEQNFAAGLEAAKAQSALKPDDAATKKALDEALKKQADAADAITAAHVSLTKETSEYKPLGEISPEKSTGRRLAFARWITARQNPLTARVAINHIWQRHFGAPLVDNMFDFGLRSPQSRNQPLLDWLAVELMDHGWQMKHIHRLLVTSATYRMRSTVDDATAANLVADADNRTLWRMNARRLEAEAVRDALFYVAGSLDLTPGGPELDCFTATSTPRRSVYFRHAYEKQMKFLEMFDGASVNECYRRSESIVPLQALALANGETSVEQSRLLAKRLNELAAKDVAPDQAFVKLAFEQILNREPTAAELQECQIFLAAESQLLQQPEKLAAFTGGTKSAVPPSPDPKQRARENLTHVLYNHNDFITIR